MKKSLILGILAVAILFTIQLPVNASQLKAGPMFGLLRVEWADDDENVGDIDVGNNLFDTIVDALRGPGGRTLCRIAT